MSIRHFHLFIVKVHCKTPLPPTQTIPGKYPFLTHRYVQFTDGHFPALVCQNARSLNGISLFPHNVHHQTPYRCREKMWLLSHYFTIEILLLGQYFFHEGVCWCTAAEKMIGAYANGRLPWVKCRSSGKSPLEKTRAT